MISDEITVTHKSVREIKTKSYSPLLVGLFMFVAIEAALVIIAVHAGIMAWIAIAVGRRLP